MTDAPTYNKIVPGFMLERFPNWLSDPKAPNAICYWAGFLARDRVTYLPVDPNEPYGRRVELVNIEVDALANMVYRAFRRKQVILVQQKLAPDVYLYFAVKCQKPLI